MIFLRAFTVWTITWFIGAMITLGISIAVWGDETTASAESWALAVTLLIQPAICYIGWLVVAPLVERLRSTNRPDVMRFLNENARRLYEWVKNG